jgi:hypothetical protein
MNPRKQTMPTTYVFLLLRRGWKSKTPVKIVSTIANCESRPRVKSIEKNRKAQNGAAGNLVTKSGYATNAKPVPLTATSLTLTPNSLAMNPRTEKMANPANSEVKQLPKHTITVSL